MAKAMPQPRLKHGMQRSVNTVLALGATLEICAAAYRKFCKRYKSKPKPERRTHWGSRLLAQI